MILAARLALQSIYAVFLFVLFFSGSQTLGKKDVPQVMQKILDYHIEYKQMSPELLQRAYRIYLDQFDGAREYLLSSEAAPYRSMSQDRLQKLLEDYQRGDLRIFDDLNGLVQKSIERARAFRIAFLQNPDALAWEDSEDLGYSARPDFASSLPELQERVRQQMVRYLHWQKKNAPFPYTRLKKALEFFDRRCAAHENGYLFINDEGKRMPGMAQEHSMTLRILKCMTAALDAHSTFFTPTEAYHLKVQLEKELYGVGVVLQESMDGVMVAKLIPGGPAEASGLIKPHDIVVEIDGQTLDELSFENALNLLRGHEHSTVALGLVRHEITGGKPVERRLQVQLNRRKIVMEEDRIKVSYEEVPGGIIGKITLYSFYEGEGGRSSERDLKDALEGLYKKGHLKGLVLDLRANSGGFLSQAIRVAGLFITNGVVAISKYSDGSVHYYRDLNGYVYFDGPLVLLTSKASASAAEVVAQSLQDWGVGLVVGDERTYGKGTIQYQTVTDERATSFFKVTIGRYYSVSGRSIQMQGVLADIIVPTQLHALDVGEKFLEYPLAADAVDAAFEDPLRDVDTLAYPWYQQYYLPTLQKKSTRWQPHIDNLRAMSQARLQKNGDYQAFLQKYRKNVRLQLQDGDKNAQDLVMEEAVSIVKDMMRINSPSREKKPAAAKASAGWK